MNLNGQASWAVSSANGWQMTSQLYHFPVALQLNFAKSEKAIYKTWAISLGSACLYPTRALGKKAFL